MTAPATPNQEPRAEQPPPDYQSRTVEAVRRDGGHIVITYAGKTFGGIVADLLASDDIRAALRPGAEIFVRTHTPDSGYAGQVAHMIMRHPTEAGWAELYADWE